MKEQKFDYRMIFHGYRPVCRQCGADISGDKFRHEVGVYAEEDRMVGFMAIFLCEKCESEHGEEQLTEAVREVARYAPN